MATRPGSSAARTSGDGSYVWVPLVTTCTTGTVTVDGVTRHYRVLVTNDGTTTYNPHWLDATATNELWLDIPDGIAPAYAPDLTLASCTSGIQATATDNTPDPIRDFTGFETRSPPRHGGYEAGPRLPGARKGPRPV
ncbi:hypothetical protein [Streptomyces sp. NPDC048411]|uniref:hypothetical protein n=1 Tax=Streptomyces sp. NPDC048411 TaxID=3157206 RepID=UPI0034533FEE